MKLYEIAGEYRDVMDDIEENGGEVTDDLQKRLDAIKDDFMAKADAMCGLIREYRAEAEALKEEENRIRARKQAAENKVESLRSYLFHHMEVMGVDKVKTGKFTAWKATSANPSIRWNGPTGIPEEFTKVERKFDYERAMVALKNGTLPEGFNVHYAKFPVIR